MSDGRPLPELDAINRHFWQGGADGRLHLLRCGGCGRWIHQPSPVCPACRSFDVAPQTVSGKGTVASFTINHQAWYPGLAVPYVIAFVDLPEQVGLRVTTNIVGCEPEAVRIGMPVKVTFEQHEDVWLPLFTPDTA